MGADSRFVWHDLNTKDVDGAKRFYAELFNWSFDASDKGPYLHIKSGAQHIGGVRAMGANEHGPTSWLGYISVDDVAASVATLTKNGGKVYMPTTAMDNVGTFAVVADPTGGVFAPWKSARPEDGAADAAPAANSFCWNELMTTDPEAAARFYSTSFGWGVDKVEMGPSGVYTLLKRPGVSDGKGGDKSAAGIWKAPPQVPYSFWLPYVAVTNTDTTVERAKRLGAQVTMPPTDIPNVGRFATMLDPQQASIAVITLAG